MTSANAPGRIGAFLSVADSDELATLSLDGLTVGTQVWNVDVGAYFKLTQMPRTLITLATTDGYAAPRWTINAATFTGHEGDTLVMVLQPPNVARSLAYTIDTVVSTHVVSVLNPPAGSSSGELFGSAVLYTDALVADSVVDANGVTGLRWVLVTTDIPDDSITAAKLDSSDKAAITAFINNATNTLSGLLSGISRAGIPRANIVLLTGADQTIAPATDKCSVYVLPADTLTADCTLTITNGSIPASANGFIVQIVRMDLSAHNYYVQNSTPTTICITTPSETKPVTYQFYHSGGIWNPNTCWYSGA